MNSGRFLSEKALQGLMLALLSAFLIAFCVINFYGFERFCTSDMYADTHIAQRMWEQKTLFPSGWVFGNQYYIVATPVLAALFYGATGSVNLAMALATTLMTLLILASFAWMLAPFTDRTQRLFGLLLLVGGILCPFAVNALEGQILYILASYYACYVITLFVAWGCYVRWLLQKEGKLRAAALAAALALSFCTGMQSLRQTAVMVIPLAAFEGCRLLAKTVRTHSLPDRRDWQVTAVAAAVCLANVAGYGVMKALAVPNVTIYGHVAQLPDSKLARNVATGFRALRSITGLKYAGTDAVGLFFTVFALFMIGLVLYFLISRVVQRKMRGDGAFFYALLGVLSLAGILAMNLVLDISLRSIYLFAWYPLVAFCAAGLAGVVGARFKRGLILFACALLVGNLTLSYLPCAAESLRPDQSLEKQVADWTRDRGYSLLYGKWYLVCEIAPYTDGEVTAGSWLEEPYRPLPYLNPLDVYSDADNSRAVYLLSEPEREEALRLASERGAVMTEVASFSDGTYKLYTSSAQLMQPPA